MSLVVHNEWKKKKKREEILCETNDGNNEAIISEWRNASNVLMYAMNIHAETTKKIQQEWKRQQTQRIQWNIYKWSTNEIFKKNFYSSLTLVHSFASPALKRPSKIKTVFIKLCDLAPFLNVNTVNAKKNKNSTNAWIHVFSLDFIASTCQMHSSLIVSE